MGLGRKLNKVKKVVKKGNKILKKNPMIGTMIRAGVSMVPGGSAAMDTYDEGYKSVKQGAKANKRSVGKQMQRMLESDLKGRIEAKRQEAELKKRAL